jgi:chromosome segregation ATPase
MKKTYSVAVATTAATLLLAFVLGDNLWPVTKAIAKRGEDAILSLPIIDQYQLKVEKTKQTIIAVEQSIQETARDYAKIKSLVVRLDTKIARSDAEVKLERAKLTKIKNELTNSGYVLTSLGSQQDSTATKNSILASIQQINFGEQRTESLNGFRTQAALRLTTLEEQVRIAPQRVQMLRRLVDDLTDKIAFLREMESLRDTFAIESSDFDEASASSAEHALVRISDDIDAELAALSALQSLKAPDSEATDGPAVSNDELISLIESRTGVASDPATLAVTE